MTVSRRLASTDQPAQTSLRTMSVSVTRATKVCEGASGSEGVSLSSGCQGL